MPDYLLNDAAKRENIRALALAAGVSEDVAAVRLEAKILLTHDPADLVARAFVHELTPVLSRTLPVGDAAFDCAVEMVVNGATARTSHAFFVGVDSVGLTIRNERPSVRSNVAPHPVMFVIAACYAASAAIYRAAGCGMPNPPREEFTIEFADFMPAGTIPAMVDLGEAFLAGAGAIGNGFLWAARKLPLKGTLHVVDYDHVSEGNLQRQIWFSQEDIGHEKAARLVEKARPLMSDCLLVPGPYRLQDHPLKTDGAWLARLIVAVDSRAARRSIQNELPGEVFDASTTTSREIVIHHNRQPTDLACLGCIYPYDDVELSHQQIIAAQLGIEVADLLANDRISPGLAARISEKHPQFAPDTLAGLAFDTLYKQLCSSGQLRTTAGKQVVAPFAFVSVLAGAVLLLEIARRQVGGAISFNDWRISPWMPPVTQLRRLRPRRSDCTCCGTEASRQLNKLLWGRAA